MKNVRNMKDEKVMEDVDVKKSQDWLLEWPTAAVKKFDDKFFEEKKKQDKNYPKIGSFSQKGEDKKGNKLPRIAKDGDLIACFDCKVNGKGLRLTYTLPSPIHEKVYQNCGEENKEGFINAINQLFAIETFDFYLRLQPFYAEFALKMGEKISNFIDNNKEAEESKVHPIFSEFKKAYSDYETVIEKLRDSLQKGQLPIGLQTSTVTADGKIHYGAMEVKLDDKNAIDFGALLSEYMMDFCPKLLEAGLWYLEKIKEYEDIYPGHVQKVKEDLEEIDKKYDGKLSPALDLCGRVIQTYAKKLEKKNTVDESEDDKRFFKMCDNPLHTLRSGGNRSGDKKELCSDVFKFSLTSVKPPEKDNVESVKLGSSQHTFLTSKNTPPQEKPSRQDPKGVHKTFSKP